ncbi:cytochrome P450 family protein [Lignipirellula cremea]|uniref:Cytochrome P450 107B1 n=1 Tax=Lignipirellula cremea TaxID=2528010 RepID=A0A518DL72_9BACT|nr:cytochrome P450 [Lignipirellula cremea]QDU92585.1 Cytochrome P450 107B1 [Lignipirellula cremea]
MALQNFDLTSIAFKRDPYPTFARMRAAGPVVRVKLPLIGEAWAATTYEAAVDVLRDQKQFALEPRHAGRKNFAGMKWWMPRSLRVLTKNMLTTDEPDHRRLRSLVEQAFQRQSVNEMRPRLVALAGRFLDHFEAAALADNGRADLMEHFAKPFPLAVICELLGLPEEDRAKFSRFASGLTNASSPWSILRAMFGIRKLLRYLKEQLAVCRRRPRPGVISALVEAEQDGQRLSEDELLAMAFLLLFAGHETTVHLIATGVHNLLRHPDQKDRLLHDWSLAESAVNETLRYVSSIQFTKPRYVRQDAEKYGVSLKRGEMVFALLGSANVDPAQFEEPETFDIGRQPNRHLGFGGGIHVCLGFKLATAETAIALESLFTRFPDLELAVPEEELRWLKRMGTRGFLELPLRLRPQATGPTAGRHAD